MKEQNRQKKATNQRSLMLPLVIMTNIVSLAAVVTIMASVKADNDPSLQSTDTVPQTTSAVEVKDTSVPTPRLPLTLSSKPKSAQNTQSRDAKAKAAEALAEAKQEQTAAPAPKELKPEEKKVISVEVNAPEQKAETAKPEAPKAVPAVAETPAESTETSVSQTDTVYESPYEGVFVVDESAGIHAVVKSTGPDGQSSVVVRFPVREHTFVEWNFSGKFDDDGMLSYTDGSKTVKYVDEWGQDIQYPRTYFIDGTGTIRVTNESLFWQENVDNIGEGLVFSRVVF